MTTVAVSTGNALTTATIVVRCPYCGLVLVTITGHVAGPLMVDGLHCLDRRCRAKRISVTAG